MLLAICCTGFSRCTTSTGSKQVTPEEKIQQAVDSLKDNAQEGDLITRLNDDILSEMIRQLADSDKSYSHSGVIVLRGDQKMVCHIYPHQYPTDTVQYEPLDSFINPKKNLSAGLFRYDLTPSEKKAFIGQLENYHDRKVHFDKRYLLETDSILYCTEMIAKSLRVATNNRFTFKTTHIQEKFIPIATKYFEDLHLTSDEVRQTAFIPLEGLYNMPYCKPIIRTTLKYMP